MALKAKSPEAVEKRLKLFLFGDYGVGKTTAAVSFPKSYVIDCEKGAENESYVEIMKANESVYMHTTDIDEIATELRSLISESHPYKTIVVDPITTLETDLVEKLQKHYPGENDMRVWRDRDSNLKRVVNLLLKADMNVVVTAHGKIDYGPNMTRLGTTFDGWKRWPFLFDLVIELKKVGKERRGYVRKTRVKNFVDGEDFLWSYDEFKARYGDILDREAKSVSLATPEQIQEIVRLVDLLKLPEDTTTKWMKKEGAESWEEFSDENLQKCIDYCKNLISGEKKKGTK